MHYSRFERLIIGMGAIAIFGALALSLMSGGPGPVEVVAQVLLFGVLVVAVHWGRRGGMIAALGASVIYIALRIPLLSSDLASRIEGLTRHHGVDLLVGEDTCRAVGEPVAARAFELWRWVEVDRVRVKGKRRPVTLFTPVVVAAERAPSFDEEVRLWQLALASYRLHHW